MTWEWRGDRPRRGCPQMMWGQNDVGTDSGGVSTNLHESHEFRLHSWIFVLIRGQPRENGRQRRSGESDVSGGARAAKEKRNHFRFERKAEGVFSWKRLGKRFSFGEAEVVFSWKRLGNRFSFWRGVTGRMRRPGRMGRLANTQTTKPRTPPDIWGQAPAGCPRI